MRAIAVRPHLVLGLSIRRPNQLSYITTRKTYSRTVRYARSRRGPNSGPFNKSGVFAYFGSFDAPGGVFQPDSQLSREFPGGVSRALFVISHGGLMEGVTLYRRVAHQWRHANRESTRDLQNSSNRSAKEYRTLWLSDLRGDFPFSKLQFRCESLPKTLLNRDCISYRNSRCPGDPVSGSLA